MIVLSVCIMYVTNNNICISWCSYSDDKSADEYAFVRALRMSGGDGANSYSANSHLQVLHIFFSFYFFFFKWYQY